MKYAVIDIGSNTIRMIVYNVENEQISIFSNRALKSELFSYTQNSHLTPEGVKWLCGAILSLKKGLTSDIKVTAFATSAFRDLKNSEQVEDIIKEKTDVDIKVLSGDEEAKCDMIALKNTGAKEGLIVDLGGGSCQIIKTQGDEVNLRASLPIGCNRLRIKFQKDDIPTKEEIDRAFEYVKSLLDCYSFESEKIYAFGGSARIIASLCKRLNIEQNDKSFSADSLLMISKLYENKEAKRILESVTPQRYPTIIMAAQILYTIAQKAKAHIIYLTDCSVSEGFLIEYVIK